MGHRMAIASPRRGRVKPVMSSRGRGMLSVNRKRTLFPSPVRNTQSPQMRQMSSPPQQQQPLAMPLPDQSGLAEAPPPPKMKREQQQEPTEDDVIEIGDDDEDSTAHSTAQPEDDQTAVKQEMPDQQPSSSTDTPPQRKDDSKFTLDSETNRSLTDFLDNLMTQHDVGPGSSSRRGSSTPARGGAGDASLSQMSHMTPKAEPMSMSWEDDPPAAEYSSPSGQHASSSFHSASQAQVTNYFIVSKRNVPFTLQSWSTFALGELYHFLLPAFTPPPFRKNGWPHKNGPLLREI